MFTFYKKMSPETFAEQVAQLLGPRLKAVILYGSAAAGDHMGRQSDFNLLLVLENIGLEELSCLSSPVKRWRRAGNTAPLLFTEARLLKSADVFPIEMLDMIQSHRVLHGDDLLTGMEVSKQHLRHQVEFELRSKLLKLREAYVLSGGKGIRLFMTLVASLSPVMVVMRAALRLYSDEVPAEKMDALRALAAFVPLDLAPFERLLEFKAVKKAPRRKELPDLFAAYIRQIETVTDAVDAI
ncbi:MAG: hypothetical protein WC360_07525 [Opitutales bacterium]|jgi:hypothetical protein